MVKAIRINDLYKGNFSMAVNFPAQSVEPIKKSQRRMVAELGSGCGHTRGGRGQCNQNARGGRGLYGGNGHGDRSGRTARVAHGRGRGRGGDKNTTTYIPPAEWNAMTSEQ